MTVEEQFKQFMTNHLPLLVQNNTTIHHYDGNALSMSMPLDSNHNDKMTGFGGSLYCLCLTASIGLAFLKAYERNMQPDLVISKASINYTAPVRDSEIIAATTNTTKKEWQVFFDTYAQTGKAKITIESHILQNQKAAVTFSGQFAIIGG